MCLKRTIIAGASDKQAYAPESRLALTDQSSHAAKIFQAIRARPSQSFPTENGKYLSLSGQLGFDRILLGRGEGGCCYRSWAFAFSGTWRAGFRHIHAADGRLGTSTAIGHRNPHCGGRRWYARDENDALRDRVDHTLYRRSDDYYPLASLTGDPGSVRGTFAALAEYRQLVVPGGDFRHHGLSHASVHSIQSSLGIANTLDATLGDGRSGR